MKLIERHIGSAVSQSILFVTLSLIGIQIFILLVDQIGDIGKGQYGLLQAIHYVMLVLPINLYRFFPFAGFLGSLLGLGWLAAHHELIACHVAGISTLQIIEFVLKRALFFLLIFFIIGEGIGPFALQKAELQKFQAKSENQSFYTEQVTGIRDQQNFILIDHIDANKNLLGITQYQFDTQHHLLSLSQAKTGEFRDKAWLLKEVQITHLTKPIKIETIPEQRLDINIAPEFLNISKIEADEMPLITLFKMIEYRKHNDLDIKTLSMSFWRRLFHPFSCLIMILLAVPFILGPLRTATMGFRIVIGILVGFSFYLANQFFNAIGLFYNIPSFIGASLPLILFTGIGIWLGKR